MLKYNNRSNSPIFIGGLFKSGTSLLRAMLGNHSRIFSGLETWWFSVDWENGRGPHGEPINQYFNRLAKFYDIEEALVQEWGQNSINIQEFISEMLNYCAKTAGKSRWAEKTPGNICHLDRIYSSWSDARVLHILRDPKDVLASLRQIGKWDQPTNFAERWCAFLPRVASFRNAGVIKDGNFLEIRYESLVTDPKVSIRSVLEFLEEPWEEAVAEFNGKKGDFQKVLEITGKESNTLERLERPLTQNRIGIWRDILSNKDIESMRASIAALGYANLLASIEADTHERGF